MAGKLKPCKPHQVRSRTTNRCRNKTKPKTHRKKKIKTSSRRRRSRSRSQGIRLERVPMLTSKTPSKQKETLSSVVLQEFERMRNAQFVPQISENKLRKIDKDMIDILHGVYRAASENKMDLQGRLNFLEKTNCLNTIKPSHDMTCGLSLVGPVDPAFKTVDPTSNLYQQVILWRTHVDSKNYFQKSDLKWAISQSLTMHDELDMCFLGEKGFTRLFLGKIVGAPEDFESLQMDSMEKEVDRIFSDDNILGSVNNYLKDYGFIEYTEYSAMESKAKQIEPIHWTYAVFVTGAISTYYFNVFQRGYVQDFVEKVIDAMDSMKDFFKRETPNESQETGPSTSEENIYINPEFFPGHQGDTNTGYTGRQLLIDQLNEVPNIPLGTSLVPSETFVPFDHIQNKLEFGKIYKFRKAIHDANYEHFRYIIDQLTFIEIDKFLSQNPTMIGNEYEPEGPVNGPRNASVSEITMIYLKYTMKSVHSHSKIFHDTMREHWGKRGEYSERIKEIAESIHEKIIETGEFVDDIVTKIKNGTARMQDIWKALTDPIPIHGPVTKPWDEGDEIPNGVSYELNAFFQEGVNEVIDGLADKEFILKKLKQFNRPGRQSIFLAGHATWSVENLEDVSIIIRELIFNAGKEDEQSILSEKGVEFLRKLTKDQIKDFNKRLVEYEKVLKKEIDDHIKLVKIQEEKGGQKPFLPYTKPTDVPKLPSIGLLNYPDMINFGDLSFIPSGINDFLPTPNVIM